MKGIVIYYSATGNTRKIAEAIHRGMEPFLEKCDIAKLKEVNPQDLIEYDLIGIGSPLYGGSEPANVRIFLHSLPEMKGKLCFPFCTHGAWPIGFMYWVAPVLTRKCMTIIGYDDWYGGVYQLASHPKPYMTDGHPDEIDLEGAEKFGREMAERAQKISSGEINLIPELPKGDDANPLWKPRENPGRPGKVMAKIWEERKLNTEKCADPECHLCVDHCPMDAIDISAEPPAFRKNCMHCYLCEAICPTGAIEVQFESGNEAAMKEGMKKFVELLNKAEAKGRFRWLVPLEKVGFDTPGYKVTGHPRYIIEED